MLTSVDLLTVGEVAERSGFTTSALRFYEREGLLTSTRTAGGQRRFERHVLRRLAFIKAARNIGLSLDEIKRALGSLPGGRVPIVADWVKVSRAVRDRLDEEIAALQTLRDDLDGCIGCGCLSIKRCRLYNREDQLAASGPGAARFPRFLTKESAGS